MSCVRVTIWTCFACSTIVLMDQSCDLASPAQLRGGCAFTPQRLDSVNDFCLGRELSACESFPLQIRACLKATHTSILILRTFAAFSVIFVPSAVSLVHCVQFFEQLHLGFLLLKTLGASLRVCVHADATARWLVRLERVRLRAR